jgi:hypothetical protein
MKVSVTIKAVLPNGHTIVVHDSREMTKPDDVLIELAHEAANLVKAGIKELAENNSRNTGPYLES